MMQGMWWIEYRLHVRHIQRSPWRWGLYLQEEEEENPADQETPTGSTRQKRELSDKEYREVLMQEHRDARTRDRQD